uniref:FBD domain-containing protein n=1 Tax=Aegilops tauschii subsp. strangulata TaxID=200361 RepID=A0A453MII5_AEGTS
MRTGSARSPTNSSSESSSASTCPRRSAPAHSPRAVRRRHLPHQLSVLIFQIHHFRGATPVQTMDAFTAALLSVCAPAERSCECQHSRAIKVIGLCFYLSAPHLSSIGSAVDGVVSRGKTKRIEFRISPPPTDNTALQLTEFGQQFMSFFRAYQVTFRWLTRLRLKSLAFGDSDITDLIRACDKLRFFNMRFCRLVNHGSALKIDTPCSGLQELEFMHFLCKEIELICVPKLRTVLCHSWFYKNPPLRLGYVPELRKISLDCEAKVWPVPFLLSECLSSSAMNLLKLHLNFRHKMVKLISTDHINFFCTHIICSSSLLISAVYLCSSSWCRYGFSRNIRSSSLLYSEICPMCPFWYLP